MYNYIGILVYLLTFLALLASAIFAFLAQKNWATVTLLLSLFFVLSTLGIGIYSSTILMEELRSGLNSYSPSEYYENILLLTRVLAISSAFFFVTGLVGFMKSSRSIYNKADSLMRENTQLAKQLNQL